MTLVAFILLVLKISIVLSVLAIGLKATPSDATFLFRKPAYLTRAVLAMYVIMPIVALLIAISFNLNPAVKIALVVLSVSPIPPILPNKSFKAGGTENYTIGVLADTSLLAIIFIPLILKVFERLTQIPLGMSAISIASKVLATIIVPLVIGIAINKFLPNIAERVARPLSLIATVLLVLSFLPVLFGALRAVVSLVGDGTLISMAVFAFMGIVIGHFLGGPETENRPVLALATATRHPAIAIAIAHVNFPDQKQTVPAVLLYLLVSAIMAVPYLNWIKTKVSTPSHKKQVPA
jgi:bile acid:Na+ symporter, BASS family